MTIKPDYADVCWEPIDLNTGLGFYHDEERWPHFRSRAECAEAIAELHRDYDDSDDGPLLLIARPCFDGPCVKILCDECGEEFSYDGGDGMHFDPADPMPVSITECEWTIEGRRGDADQHYCPDCPGFWCDECGEQHHGSCPELQSIPVSDDQLQLITVVGTQTGNEETK